MKKKLRCKLGLHKWKTTHAQLGIEHCIFCSAERHKKKIRHAKKLIAIGVLLISSTARAQVGQQVQIVDGRTGQKAVVTNTAGLMVNCTNCSGGGGGSGLTNAELRATPVIMTFTNSGIAVTSVAGTVAVSGPLTDTQLRAAPLAVTGAFYQATQPVSGTFWQAVQPVSGPLTDAQLRASPVAVSGDFTSDGLTDAQLRAAAVPVSASSLPLPSGAATEATLLTRTKPADQQHAIVDSSALPTGASTEATLALIKAKTDNIDVALSTRTKPADTQTIAGAVTGSGNFTVVQPTGTNLHTVVDSAPTTAVTNAGLSNLDVALSTRTKPADQQHAIVDSSALPSGAATDAAVLALTKPADQQHAIVDSSALPSGAATSATQTDRTQKTQITDGTRDGTVKAASTLPALSDTAIVTTQRDPLPAGTNVIGHMITDATSTTTVTQATGTNLHTVDDGQDTIGTPVALNALNVVATVAMKGQLGASVQFTAASASLSGTVTPQFSIDNGVTWSDGQLFFGGVTATALVYTGGTTPTGNVYTFLTSGIGGITDFRVKVTSYTSGTITATLRATTGPALQSIVGNKTHNSNTSVGATQVGVLPAVNNAAAPTFTETTIGFLSQDLSGNLRVKLGGSSTTTVTQATGTNLHVVVDTAPSTTVTQATAANLNAAVVGTIANNNTAPVSTNNLGVLPAIASAAAQTYTEGNAVLLSTDKKGNLREVRGDSRGQYVGQKNTYTGAITMTNTTSTTSPFFTICGNATTVERVQHLRIGGSLATTAKRVNILLKKTATATSGGTATTLAWSPHDSSFAPVASVGQIKFYTVPGSTGASGGFVGAHLSNWPVTATVASTDQEGLAEWFWNGGYGESEAIVLRGTAECLEAAFDPAPGTVPTIDLEVTWTEE